MVEAQRKRSEIESEKTEPKPESMFQRPAYLLVDKTIQSTDDCLTNERLALVPDHHLLSALLCQLLSCTCFVIN
ncbi:hypothetical protein T07_13428 [Trichinella nelsoni]|uniref:Uncharacterized protein n=1 Tax=Trichinella nelsoni TaxID=6336 RepID=A0A0V0S2X4_9BILA|nr:hypothetical protein T07_13428 [Trichinella nelsoni]